MYDGSDSGIFTVLPSSLSRGVDRFGLLSNCRNGGVDQALVKIKNRNSIAAKRRRKAQGIEQKDAMKLTLVGLTGEI